MYQDIYNCICQNTKKKIDLLSIMLNLQANCCLKFYFQKVDQHGGGKWLIHDTKCRKDNQLQDCRISIANTLEILQSCTKPLVWLTTLAGSYYTLKPLI